jgi:Recombinase
MISARTKAALPAAKRRGVEGTEAPDGRPKRARLYSAPAAEPLTFPRPSKSYRAGCESLRAIAAGLEERGIPTVRGGKWSAVQVARLLEAASIPFDRSSRPFGGGRWMRKDGYKSK